MTNQEAKTCSPTSACGSALNPPCITWCPIGQDAPLYIRHIRNGEYSRAWDVILKDNPFGMTCGSVCDHKCELFCKAGEYGDPIAIRQLKRHAAEHARKVGYKPSPPIGTSTGKKVAVVGGGPAGLTAAYFLRAQGHDVTIFEASDKIGGMLSQTYPEYRLPDEDVQFDLANIIASGFKVEYGKKLGVNFTVKELRNSFDAVFIAFGASASWKLDIRGEESAHLRRGIEFLADSRAGKDINPGERVIVIGGGNVAIDVARVALRKGSRQVDIFYRRRRVDMPADKDEITRAEEEGIRVHTGWGPVSISDTGAGLQVTFKRYTPATEEGRNSALEYDEQITTTAIADVIYTATGEHPENSITADDLPIHVEPWGGVIANVLTQATNVDGVFAGGDCVTGPSSLIEAIASGKRAAHSIGQYLKGARIEPASPMLVKNREWKLPARPGVAIPEISRRPIPLAPARERRSDSRRVELDYSDEEAIREATRCLECDLDAREDSRLRRFVQFSALFATNGYWSGFYLTFKNKAATIYQGQLKAACIPGLHCYSCPSATLSCPIGSFQFWLNNMKSNLHSGTVDLIGLYIVGFLGMVGALVGRAACGWICPFGLFQEMMYKIPSPIRLKIPKVLRYLKYVVLIVTVILLPLLLVDEYGMGLGPWFCKVICPSGTLTGGVPLLAADASLREQIHVYFPIKATILVIFLFWMVLSQRAFCRTTCPLGAFWSMFNRNSILRIGHNPNTCDNCNTCQTVCPVDIHPPTEAQGGECVRCMNCIGACHVKSLSLEIAGLEVQPEILKRLGAGRGIGVISKSTGGSE